MKKIILQKSRTTKKTKTSGIDYLGTEDLRPELEFISDPIYFTGQAFEQHINWEDKDKAAV